MAESKLETLEQQLADLQRREAQLEEDQKSLDSKSLAYKEKELEISKNLEKIHQKNLDISRKIHQDDAQHIKDLETQKLKTFLITEELKQQKQLMAEIQSLSKSFASDISNTLGIVEDMNKSAFGRFFELTKKTGSAMEAINASAAHLSKNLGKRVLISIAEKGQEMLIGLGTALDSASASMAKAIPQGREYNRMVEDIASSNGVAFASFEDVANSIKSMNSGFSGFIDLQDSQKRSLAELSTTMEQIGVSTDDFAKNLDVTTRAMGFSTKEFEKFEGTMFSWSKKLGVSMDKMNKDFLTASPRLAAFSKNKAVQTFKEMAVASKNLGIEMNKMLDITSNFETFEGAAEAAGSLNSVLGGNVINTLDLMDAALDNPIEVFKQFKGALDKTGKSFEHMTPAMKKTIAEMMKMDVSELSRLTSMDMEEGIEQLKNEAESMKAMQEAAKAATPILEKLQKIFYKFAVFLSPVVDALGKVVDFLGWLAGTPIGGALGGIVMGFGAIATAGIAAVGAFTFVKAALLSFGATATGILPAIGTGVGSALGAIGKGAQAGAVGFLALGAAIALAGAGIGVAAWGLSKLVEAFKGIPPGEILSTAGAITVFSFALSGMILQLGALAPMAMMLSVGLLPFIGAIYLLGTAAESAGNSMNKFVSTDILAGLTTMETKTRSIGDNIERIKGLNSSLSVNGSNTKVQQQSTGGSQQNVTVSLPEEMFKVHLTVPVTLDGIKMGDFVQEQIVKREDRMFPGKLYNAVGIKTGNK